jgi:tetratricopeptide (TPR) repeat protein
MNTKQKKEDRAKKVNALVLITAFIILIAIFVSQLEPVLYFTNEAQWYAQRSYKEYLMGLGEGRALSLVGEAIRADPNYGGARVMRSLIYSRMDELEEAEKEVQLVLSDPNSSFSQDAFIQLVKIRMRQCRHDEALALAQEGMRKFPRDPQFFFYGGIILAKQGNTTSALKMLRWGESMPAAEGYAPYRDLITSKFPLLISTIEAQKNGTNNSQPRAAQKIDSMQIHGAMEWCLW